MANVIRECRRHVRKIVLGLQPAAVDGVGSRFRAHKSSTGNILRASERDRLFDVIVNSAGSLEPSVMGSTSLDYDVPMNVVIGYGLNDDYLDLALGDYSSIRFALHNCDIGSVTGLHYYLVGQPSFQDLDDYRFMVVPFVARITWQ